MAGGGIAVRHHVLAVGVRLADRGGHLLDGELEAVDGVARRHDAARAHQLDLGRAAADLLAGGAADGIDAVADLGLRDEAGDDRRLVVAPARALVPVAAALRQERAGRQDARAGDLAALDGGGERCIEAAGVAHGREPLVERDADVLDHLQDVADPALRRVVLAVRGDAEVDVRVGQPRHERHTAAVDDARAVGRGDRARGTDPGDAARLAEDARARPGVAARWHRAASRR